VTLISGARRMSLAARLVVILLALVCCAVWASPAAAMRSYRSAGEAPASQVVLGSSLQTTQETPEMYRPGELAVPHQLLGQHPDPLQQRRGYLVTADATSETSIDGSACSCSQSIL
jgi:hypothetical protein